MIPPRAAGAVSAAALALEQELARIEGAIREASRAPLTSRRALEQAASRLGELAGVEKRVGPLVEELARAMSAMVDRQRAASQAVAARAEEIAARRQALAVLLARHEDIGREAAALNACARDASSRLARDDGHAQVFDLSALAERLGHLALGARALGATARELGFRDVERDAQAMEQQLFAARNALVLAAERNGRGAAT